MDLGNSVGYTPIRNDSRNRSRTSSASTSDFIESPGKKYPRLLVLLLALCIFCFISWLPFLAEKNKGPLAFVWPVNQSRNARELILPDKRTTILTPDVCRASNTSKEAHPFLLVIVCSSVPNFEARYSIRESWAKETEDLKKVKVVFLVGTEVNDTHQEQILSESEQYGDIIQESFIDTYANLTVKSLFLLKWFNTHCDKTQYVMKADDDMYINLDRLYATVQANKRPNLLMGSLICNAIPIKDPYNKWYVPQYMFAGKRYPNYLSGTSYLMAKTTVAKLYNASLDTPMFHLEDIFVTGMLSARVRIRPVDNIGFSYVRRKLNSCLFKQSISTHKVKLIEMKAIYDKLLTSKNQECPKLKSRLLRDYGPGKCSWPKV